MFKYHDSPNGPYWSYAGVDRNGQQFIYEATDKKRLVDMVLERAVVDAVQLTDEMIELDERDR